VPIAIHRNAFRHREIARSIAVLSEGPYELAIGIEDLDPVIEHVGNVDVPVLIERHARRLGKVSQCVRRVVGIRSSDGPQRRQIVRIEYQHLIQSNIGDIKEPVLVVDRHSRRSHQPCVIAASPLWFLSNTRILCA